MDVAAPSESNDASLFGPYPAYTLSVGVAGINYTFNGTSMAAPHVTGTVALLMSYLDSTASVPGNLSPEDAEHFIIRSAVDVDTPGKDNNTGWGLLNAGRALQQVNKECKEFRHYDVRNAHGFIQYRPYGGAVHFFNVRLTEPYTSPDGIYFNAQSYRCLVYSNTDTIYQGLPGKYQIEDYWPRHSSTNLLPLLDTTTHLLSPHEHLDIKAINNNFAVLQGFYYSVYDSTGAHYLGLWGKNDTIIDTLGLQYGFAYSVLLRDTTKHCNSLINTSVKEISSDFNINFYPNPVYDRGDLTIFMDKPDAKTKIEIVDVQGRTVNRIYEGNLSEGTNNFDVNTNILTSGIYMIRIDMGESKRTIKFSKL